MYPAILIDLLIIISQKSKDLMWAERERRAKGINAEGEFQAAAKVREAAQIIQDFPYALQLRNLQTLREVGAQSSSKTLFPIPIDLFKPFTRKE